MKNLILLFWILFLLPFATDLNAQNLDTTYAEKLGFPRGSKVLILHVDDAGMSYDSNIGAEKALTEGVSNSVSIMMPCSWVPGFMQFLKIHPKIDAGVHLTLTSEWDQYRWGPIAGKSQVPGLCDPSGYLWSSVENVVVHSNSEEIDKEIRAQLAKARSMGLEPTHLDSHMGTLFARGDFLMKYVMLGIENQIPIMLPGGKDILIAEQNHASQDQIRQLQGLGRLVWSKGLPVLDDLHNFSYEWLIPEKAQKNDKELSLFKTQKYIDALKLLKPGLTMMIMHCTLPIEDFPSISSSGPVRKGDLLAMMNPTFKQALKDQGIILTTWRELMARRKSSKN